VTLEENLYKNDIYVHYMLAYISYIKYLKEIRLRLVSIVYYVSTMRYIIIYIYIYIYIYSYNILDLENVVCAHNTIAGSAKENKLAEECNVKMHPIFNCENAARFLSFSFRVEMQKSILQ